MFKRIISYEEQIEAASRILKESEAVIIGAGAGLSTAAGLNYGGKRFTDNFSEFIEKYGKMYMKDMYTAGFYPFPTQEAKWGYWSKHAYLNRIEPDALPLYKMVYELVKDKPHFVLTTNVDHQFWKAGFEDANIFATQGDYGRIQCEKGCHAKTYDAISMFEQMNQARCDCEVPRYMVPKCPVCGGNMTMYLRCDQYFVEDEAWNQAALRYRKFLKANKNKKVALLELGVGFNTPIIIRLPFEKMVSENNNYSLIRLNLDEAVVPECLGRKAVGINADMAKSIEDLSESLGKTEKASKTANTSNQEARLDYLLDRFKEDSVQYKDLEVGDSFKEKRKMLRSLMNIRMPRSMDEAILEVQDAFLSEEAKEKGIVTLDEIPTIKEQYQSGHPFADKLSIWQGDITRLQVGAIVNAANSQMLGCFVPCHKCIDNAIHSAAGIELREECNHQMHQRKIKFGPRYEEPTGQAMVTKAYNLPAEHVIHTVGPIVSSRLTDRLRQDLKNCYTSVLESCVENQIRSVAFCCISTGEFRFPNDEAARIAVNTVSDFLEEHISDFERVIFNVFKEEDKEYYKKELA